MIIKSIFRTISHFFMLFVSTLVTLVTYPLVLLLDGLLIDTSSFNDIMADFFTRILNGVAFAREVFFNCTGFPPSLFYTLLALLEFKISFIFLSIGFKFCLRLYYALRGFHVS